MKRLSLVLAFTLVLGAGSVWAQDVPKLEVFGGGSVLNIDDGHGFKLTPFGWTGSVAGNVNKAVGIVGEVGGNYRNGYKLHSFLGGGQFTHRVDKVSVFAQAKAGFLNFRGGLEDDNNFQLGFGGGIDWNLTPKLAFRVFQFDWLPTRAEKVGGTGNEWVKNLTRGSIGIVFKGEPK